MSLHKSLRGNSLHSPSSELVTNSSGSTIPTLMAVTFNAIGNVYPLIVPANGGTDIVRGITQTDITNGSDGYITSLGFLIGVDTSSWAPGTVLYVNSTGHLITSVNGLPIATVLKQDSVNGQIYVNAVGVNASDISANSFPPEAELEWMFAIPHSRPYQTFAYNGNNDMVDMDVWADNTLAVHVFNRHFTYDINGRLLTVVTTNLISSLTKTKTFYYGINGYLTSVQES